MLPLQELGSIPGWGTKILCVMWCSQKQIFFKFKKCILKYKGPTIVKLILKRNWTKVEYLSYLILRLIIETYSNQGICSIKNR